MPTAKAAQPEAFQYTASHWSTALLVGRDGRANQKIPIFYDCRLRGFFVTLQSGKRNS